MIGDRDIFGYVFKRMGHLDVSFKHSIVKTSNKRCNCFLAYEMLTKIVFLFITVIWELEKCEEGQEAPDWRDP